MSDGESTRLREAVPAGVRSEFLRALVSMSLDKVEELGPGLIGLILTDLVELAPKSGCQILAQSEEAKQDEN